MGVSKGIRAKNKKRGRKQRAFRAVLSSQNENFKLEMSPSKSTSPIRPTGDICKFPPVTPLSLQNENKESFVLNVR